MTKPHETVIILYKMKFYQHKIENLIVIDKLISIHYDEYPKGYSFAGEAHDFWEIVFCDAGSVICERDGEEVILSQGQVIFHKPNEFHTIRTNGNSIGNALIFTFTTKSNAMSFFQRHVSTLPQDLLPYMANILLEARNTFNLLSFNANNIKATVLADAPLGGQQMIRTYIEQFLIRLMREHTATHNTLFVQKELMPNHIASAVIDYLKAHLHKRMCVENLCRAMHYSRSSLSQKFKSVTGKTITEYYSELRITEAKRMLYEERLPITKIADSLCFDSPAHFAAWFKNHTALTPTQYKVSINSLSE